MTEHYLRLQERVRALGLSEHGSAWLLKALYPPGPGPAAAVPDGQYAPTLVTDHRVVATIDPSGLDADENWDACIVIPPGDNVAAIIQTGAAGTNFYAPLDPLGRTVIGNQQAITSASTRLSGLRINFSAATGNIAEIAGSTDATETYAHRLTHKSATLHCTAAAVSDSGSITVGQFPLEWRRTDRALAGDRATYSSVCRAYAAPLPLSEEDVLRAAPGATTTDFRDGAYVPTRLTGFSFSERSTVDGLVRPDNASGVIYPQGLIFYSPSNSGNLALGNLSSALVPASYMVTRSARTPSTVLGALPWLGAGGDVSTDTYAYDTAPGDACTTVMILRGLDPRASFTLTVRTGVERAVDPESGAVSFCRAPPAVDARAIAAYQAIAAEMGYVYPASYNAVGAILPLIAKALAVVGPIVAPMLKNLAVAGARHVVDRFTPPAPPRQAKAPNALTPAQQAGPRKRAKAKPLIKPKRK